MSKSIFYGVVCIDLKAWQILVTCLLELWLELPAVAVVFS